MAFTWRLTLAVVFIVWQMTLEYCVCEHSSAVNIRKCCKEDAAWNVKQHGCDYLPPQWSHPKLKEIIPWPVKDENYTISINRTCAENTSLQFLNPRDSWHKYETVKGGKLRLVHPPSFELDSNAFCIDRANTSYEPIVMACLPPNWTKSHTSGPKLHFHKCCPQGQRYINDSCHISNTNWRPPDVINSQSLLVELFEHEWSVNYGFPNCGEGERVKTLDRPGLVGPGSEYVLYDNGTLYSERYQILLQPNEFCMDETLVNDKSFMTIQMCFRDPCVNKTCINSCYHPLTDLFASNVSCKIPYALRPPSLKLKYDKSMGHSALTANEHDIIGDPLCAEKTRIITFSIWIDALHVDQRGQSYVVLQGKSYSNYCIGYFLNRRNVLEMQVKVCSEQFEDPLVIRIYGYLFLFSSGFLLATFLVYAVLPELQNIHGKTTMSLVFSLFIAYLCLGIVQITESKLIHCELIATVMHFFFLAAFTWMGTMSFDIMWTFTWLRIPKPGQEQQTGQFIRYSIFAWGVPLVIVTIGQILDNTDGLPKWITTPNFGLDTCWTNQLEKLRYFYGPIAGIIVINMIFFAITAGHFYAADNNCHAAIRKRRANQRLRVVLSMSVLMGLTWITEVVSWSVGSNGDYYWMPTDIVNILQAVLIFFIFVNKPKVKRLLQSRIVQISQKCQANVARIFPGAAKDQGTSGTSNLSPSEYRMKNTRNTTLTSLTGQSLKSTNLAN